MAVTLQIIGASIVLVAFVAVQIGRTHPSSYLSLGLNLIGSLLLAGLALVGGQWGFLLMESVWAAVSAWGLVGRLLGRRPAPA